MNSPDMFTYNSALLTLFSPALCWPTLFRVVMSSLANSSNNERLIALQAWASHVLRSTSPLSLEPLCGDAGFRRYYRFAPSGAMSGKFSSLLAVDAPPATENSLQFIAIAQTLSRRGIRTPAILFADTDNGFLIIEDFGDELFANSALDNIDVNYNQALNLLSQLQQLEPATALLPNYDGQLLRQELGIFSEWFVSQFLAKELTAADQEPIEQLFLTLVDEALAQPTTWVHRDFHSRNLMWCDDGELGVIDFQGAVLGPITYDLVSLLKDCYLKLPNNVVLKLAFDYRATLIDQGSLPGTVSETAFIRWFDLMGLQRHIKVLGIFARLALRDNKPHYLRDLPLVMDYVLDVLNRYPEFSQVLPLFENNLAPALAARLEKLEHAL